MDDMSVRAGIAEEKLFERRFCFATMEAFKQVGEFSEEVAAVVGARAGFWMILHAESRCVCRSQTFYRAVVEIEMSDGE